MQRCGVRQPFVIVQRRQRSRERIFSQRGRIRAFVDVATVSCDILQARRVGIGTAPGVDVSLRGRVRLARVPPCEEGLQPNIVQPRQRRAREVLLHIRQPFISVRGLRAALARAVRGYLSDARREVHRLHASGCADRLRVARFFERVEVVHLATRRLLLLALSLPIARRLGWLARSRLVAVLNSVSARSPGSTCSGLKAMRPPFTSPPPAVFHT
eukprot:312912-Prymnesium_polylepis.2